MGPNTVRRTGFLALAGLVLGVAGARADTLELLGQPIAPGDQRRLPLPVSETFVGEDASTPVIVVAGTQPGPVLCLMAGIHGDELNGIEVVRRSLDGAKPDELKGTLVGIPIVNLAAFRRSSRYMPDRRDLNRFFPGTPRGSSASRLAYSVFEKVVRQCDALVDVHSGSFNRTNLPQVRGDLRRPEVLRLARAFGSEIAIHNEGRAGTLRRAASEAGIPAITYEAGEPMRFQSDEIERGVLGVEHMLSELGMRLAKTASAPEPELYYRARWIRARSAARSPSTTRVAPAHCAARRARPAFPQSRTRRASRCASSPTRSSAACSASSTCSPSSACGSPRPRARPSPSSTTARAGSARTTAGS